MSAARKPRLESTSERLPLLLVINHEIRGERHRNIAALAFKLLLLAAVVFGVLNMMHGIARG